MFLCEYFCFLFYLVTVLLASNAMNNQFLLHENFCTEQQLVKIKTFLFNNHHERTRLKKTVVIKILLLLFYCFFFLIGMVVIVSKVGTVNLLLSFLFVIVAEVCLFIMHSNLVPTPTYLTYVPTLLRTLRYYRLYCRHGPPLNTYQQTYIPGQTLVAISK